MNIMLVSVTERRKKLVCVWLWVLDKVIFLQQFLIEAILVCLIGGVLGVLLSLGLGQLINVCRWQLLLSPIQPRQLLLRLCVQH